MQALHVQTSTRERATLDEDAVVQLRQALRGELLEPDDPAYEEARKVWNGMIDKHPALIARCVDAADVSTAVRFARAHDVLLSVRGGGHNVAGRALCEDGLVIDLSRMRAVRVDPVQRTVHVQGGATLGEVDRETQAFGLAVPVGLVTATGIAGLTLHGGMGWLTRNYGLTLDNLISADVVTADGRLRRASETENADLFWALRGGGGNFGVVTSFEFRAYPVGPDVWFSVVVYPIAQAPDVLRSLREYMSRAPEELGILAALWSAPQEPYVRGEYWGAPALILLACYTGPPAKGEAVTRPLHEMAAPVGELSEARPYVEVQRFFDADYPDGMLYYWKSVYLEDFRDEVIDAILNHAAARPSALSSIDIWFVEGALNRVPADRTAYVRREVKYGLALESNWTDPEQSNTNIAWTRGVFEDLQRFSRGTYLNFPGFLEDADKLLQGAYGANYERLQTIKAKYDPDNLFHGALNIVPGPRS